MNDKTYYVVVVGFDTENKKSVTRDCVLTLSDMILPSVEGIQEVKRIFEEDLNMKNISILNQIEIAGSVAATTRIREI